MDFFFDNQTRRYLIQFIRIFSDVKVRIGPDANGLYKIQRVPIVYGDPSWMVAQLIKGASENTMLPSPMFSAWIENIKIVPERRQSPQYVGKASVIEREFNPLTQTYSHDPGVRQDIERYMPVPYDLFLRLDLWTTNTTTKLQIMEQICTIFNPSLQLQQNDNILDWTSIFEVWLEDVIWSNRNIPQGGEQERDVMSFKFKVQAWINPPAKLKRSGLIAEIVTRVFDTASVGSIEESINSGNNYDPFKNLSATPIQIVTTEGNYKISVAKGSNTDYITLLNEYGRVDPALSWKTLIQEYGQITPNITKIRLKLDADLDVSSSDIIGTIEEDPNNQNILFFVPDFDTLPTNTLLPITTIIDPTEVSPGNGLPMPAPGQRYLLTSNNKDDEPIIPFGVPTSPWGIDLVAYQNDIIQFNGVSWVVSFDSRNAAGKNYVVNNENSCQYTFDSSIGHWTYTYYGTYRPGYWRIDNIISAPNGTVINQYE